MYSFSRRFSASEAESFVRRGGGAWTKRPETRPLDGDGAARGDKTPSLWTYHKIRPTKNVATHKKGFQDLHFYTIIIGRGSQSLSGARGHEAGGGAPSTTSTTTRSLRTPTATRHVPSPVLMYFPCPHLDLSLRAKLCDLLARDTAKPRRPPPPRPEHLGGHFHAHHKAHQQATPSAHH